MTRLLDPLLALALIVIGIGGTAPAAENQGLTVRPWAYPLVIVVAAAIAVRRRWPVAVLAVTALGAGVYLALGNAYGPILAGPIVAAYTVAAYRPLRPAALAAGGAIAVLLVHLGLRDIDRWVGILPVAAWIVVPFALGVVVRVNRESTARARADEARRTADAERLRVAQEVHDVVGHGLSAISMQAEIALHLLGKQPGQAEAALTAIARTSRDSLDELKATLAVVRAGAADADRAPTPGLARLDDLVARVRAAGVPVAVEVRGTRPQLPAVTDLTAYRVVQESLTNVLRHAGPATASVLVSFADPLEVRVTDTGRGGPVVDAGHGLVGMRERVTALGGAFTAGPRAEGGFEVRATLPVAS